jgi:hypothetical protein
MNKELALMSYFGDVKDPRRDQGKRHLLSDILALTIGGVLCGANTWVESEEYGENTGKVNRSGWQRFWNCRMGSPRMIP